MIRRLVACAALVAGAVPAAAQTTASPAPPSVEIFPRTAFHLSAELLSDDDERFTWDTNFGGELDVVDYGVGRLTFVANYQAVLGGELRRFDPNQGNYILEGSASVRARRLEIAGVFYHQSRHLSDRPKVVPIDWNMLGVRVRSTATLGATRLDMRADVRGAIQRSFVDYRWELDGRVRADHRLRPGVGVLLGAGFRRLGVDGTRNRGGQTGFRGEAGIRVEGRAGAAELFAAVERRVDPSPLQFETATWAIAGFRLLSR
jgi:hypothetical protein